MSPEKEVLVSPTLGKVDRVVNLASCRRGPSRRRRAAHVVERVLGGGRPQKRAVPGRVATGGGIRGIGSH
jgi:hypothetical protein